MFCLFNNSFNSKAKPLQSNFFVINPLKDLFSMPLELVLYSKLKFFLNNSYIVTAFSKSLKFSSLLDSKRSILVNILNNSSRVYIIGF